MDAKNTTLDDISAEIGLTATLRLSAWFGGDRCYVPFKVEEDQLLVKLIGASAARKLTLAYPGESLAIPPLTQYELDLRARQIGRMLIKGFTTREIANWVKMTERRVQQICRELEIAGLIEPVGPGKKQGDKAAREKTRRIAKTPCNPYKADGPSITLPAVCEATGLDEAAIDAGVLARTFPAPVRVSNGGKSFRYVWLISDIQAWKTESEKAEAKAALKNLPGKAPAKEVPKSGLQKMGWKSVRGDA